MHADEEDQETVPATVEPTRGTEDGASGGDLEKALPEIGLTLKAPCAHAKASLPLTLLTAIPSQLVAWPAPSMAVLLRLPCRLGVDAPATACDGSRANRVATLRIYNCRYCAVAMKIEG